MRCAPMATADPASARRSAAHRVATDPESRRSRWLLRRNSIPWRCRRGCRRIRSANGSSAMPCRLLSKPDEASDRPHRAGLAEATEAAFDDQRCASYGLKFGLCRLLLMMKRWTERRLEKQRGDECGESQHAAWRPASFIPSLRNFSRLANYAKRLMAAWRPSSSSGRSCARRR